MLTILAGFLFLFPQLIDSTDKLEKPAVEAEDLSHEKRADIYMARKMYREAVDEYKRAIDEQPAAARLYNKLGISFHHQLMFDNARRYYERATDLDSKFSQAINNLGTIYYAEGRYKKAQKTYEKALKVSPRSASIYSNLGTAFFARGKYKKASEAYVTALEIDPGVFESRSNTGTMLQERSVKERGKYYYFMAEAYAQAGMFDQALIYLRRCAEEGFRSPKRIWDDAKFEEMREMPEFQVLFNPEGAVDEAE